MSDNIEYSTTGKPHPYHILEPSPWPLLASLAGGIFSILMVLYMHEKTIAGINFGTIYGPIIGVTLVTLVAAMWWRDCIYEAITLKAHTKITEIGFRYGMALFIGSEVMFFVAFFWAFFNGALFPNEAMSFQWPPPGIEIIDPFDLPLMMTLILLLSGCTVTWAHHAVMEGKNDEFVQALGLSVFLGFFFLGFQVYEYTKLSFGFSDNFYSSAFYMATGFHGFHVLVGTIFLAVCWIRGMMNHYTPEKHFSFEAAAWYWHFVDVVWLFLFVAIYWWGNTIGMDLSDSPAALQTVASAAVP